ncbi:MAG: helix-turn-helix domain-containing protein [Pirellulaceae bacterium]|nr:helix-turn-helix domain-containing protein [Pirellulaceae bacterium]
MAKASRKQLEIQQREADILQISRRTLLEEGYEALSMDKLAAELGTAKGTLYNHFDNKEEIVLALVCQAMQVRQQMFGIAAMVSQKTRERMMAIGLASELYVQHHAEHFAIEQFVSNSTIRGKSKPERQELIRHFETQCMSSVSSIARDAIAVGDLSLPPQLTVEELVFGFWSITFGSHVLTFDRPALNELGINDAWRAVRMHGCSILNGFNWKPLMTFEESEEVFAGLVTRLKVHFSFD